MLVDYIKGKFQLGEFKEHWQHYVFQSFFAAVAIFVALLLLNIEQRPIMIASIGATAFIVFAMPKDITAKARNVLGGHLIGILCGSLCAIIPHFSNLSSYLVYSLAVGVAIFIMVVVDTEHPPAAGTALSVAIHGFSLKASIQVMLIALMLSLILHFAKSKLRNLV